MRYKIFIKKTDRRHFAEKKNRQSVSLFVVSILSFLFRLGFWSQEATRSSKPYVKLMFTSKQLSMCVCANLLLPNLAKLFASNCRCCYCSCYIMCFFKREMPVCMWSSQHAHHPMLKMILHVNAYGFLSLSYNPNRSYCYSPFASCDPFHGNIKHTFSW